MLLFSLRLHFGTFFFAFRQIVVIYKKAGTVSFLEGSPVSIVSRTRVQQNSQNQQQHGKIKKKKMNKGLSLVCPCETFPDSFSLSTSDWRRSKKDSKDFGCDRQQLPQQVVPDNDVMEKLAMVRDLCDGIREAEAEIVPVSDPLPARVFRPLLSDAEWEELREIEPCNSASKESIAQKRLKRR